MGTTDSNEAKYWPEFYGLCYAEHTSIALLRRYYLSDIETFNEDTGSVGTLQEPNTGQGTPNVSG